MHPRNFLKPNIFSLAVFSFIAIFYLYFAAGETCGISPFFQFCYKEYGFPLSYAITGEIETASGYIKTTFLGDSFSKYGNILFNPLALILDIALIYLLSCFIAMLFRNMKIRN